MKASQPAKSISSDAAGKVRAYFAARPAGSRKALKQMRDAIRAAAPNAVEAFGYGMPGFKLDGRVLIWYAAWKAHTSLYPMSTQMERDHAAAIKPYETSSRGTIRFPLEKTMPVALIKKLVKSRMAEMRSARKG
jgi:uncharacterized protein YdhG (YjbR/CyaY superfamily)